MIKMMMMMMMMMIAWYGMTWYDLQVLQMLSDDIIPAAPSVPVVAAAVPGPIKLGLQVAGSSKAKTAAKTSSAAALTASLDDDERMLRREVVKLEYSEEELREMERGDSDAFMTIQQQHLQQQLLGMEDGDLDPYSDSFGSYRRKKGDAQQLVNPGTINPADISNIHAKVSH